MLGVLLYPFMEGTPFGPAVLSTFAIVVLFLAVRAVQATSALVWIAVLLGIPIAVLTVLEVGLAYLDKQLGKTALVTGLVGLALAKATCVALYYMHLKHETKYMRYTVGFPMVFPALYAFILIAEGIYRALWGST